MYAFRQSPIFKKIIFITFSHNVPQISLIIIFISNKALCIFIRISWDQNKDASTMTYVYLESGRRRTPVCTYDTREYLMLRFIFWVSRKCWVPLTYYYSQVHSEPERSQLFVNFFCLKNICVGRTECKKFLNKQLHRKYRFVPTMNLIP